jgi:hypothetical protein
MNPTKSFWNASAPFNRFPNLHLMLSADSNWMNYDWWCSAINKTYLLHCCSNDISTNSNQLTASNEDLGTYWMGLMHSRRIWLNSLFFFLRYLIFWWFDDVYSYGANTHAAVAVFVYFINLSLMLLCFYTNEKEEAVMIICFCLIILKIKYTSINTVYYIIKYNHTTTSSTWWV